MDELKFVMKCLILACFLFSASQYKSEGVTIEARVHSYLVSSPVAEFVNNSARGAVKLIHEAKRQASNYLDKKERVIPVPRKVKQTESEDIDLE